MGHPFELFVPGVSVGPIRLADGITLECAQYGRRGGLPVLMLHGITDSWRSFGPLLPWLPPHWHVVMPSQRGHGGSDKDAPTYRACDFAADAAALLDALGITRPAVVVGHSMGAANALQLAADRPARVRAVVAAGAFASFADKPDLRAWVDETVMPLADPVPLTLARDFQAGTIRGAVADGLLESMTQESLKVPAAVWRAAFSGLFDDSFVPGLERMQCPALVLWGDADAFVPEADTLKLLARLPEATLAVYRGAGHALHWEQPERFVRDLVRFVDGAAG